jgi:hypothetical protein
VREGRVNIFLKRQGGEGRGAWEVDGWWHGMMYCDVTL